MPPKIVQRSKYAFGYRRVSTLDQAKEGRVTLKAQNELIENYCKDNKLVLLKVFEDPGISGRETCNREGYLQMLDVIKDFPGATIVIFDTSRLNRNASESTAFYKDLTSRGCRIISLTQNIDSDEPNAEFQWNLYSAFDNEESKKISIRTKAAIKNLSDAGAFVSRSPFGWIKDPATRKLMPEPDQQVVLERILQLYKDGTKPGKIAKILNEDGSSKVLNNNKKTPSANPRFSPETIKIIVTGHGLVPENKPAFTVQQRVANWNANPHYIKR